MSASPNRNKRPRVEDSSDDIVDIDAPSLPLKEKFKLPSLPRKDYVDVEGIKEHLAQEVEKCVRAPATIRTIPLEAGVIGELKQWARQYGDYFVHYKEKIERCAFPEPHDALVCKLKVYW